MSESVIPVRKQSGNEYSGKCGMKIIEEFGQEIYRLRNMDQTVFSAIKRKYGDTVRSGKCYSQAIEMKKG